MAKYMLTILEDEARYTGEGFAELMVAHQKFAAEVAELGCEIVNGEALQPTPTATFLRDTRTDNVRSVDSPLPEVKEVLGGYYVIEAPSPEAARKAAERCPAPFGYIEMRPVMTFDN